jgi:hypothetical protein
MLVGGFIGFVLDNTVPGTIDFLLFYFDLNSVQFQERHGHNADYMCMVVLRPKTNLSKMMPIRSQHSSPEYWAKYPALDSYRFSHPYQNRGDSPILSLRRSTVSPDLHPPSDVYNRGHNIIRLMMSVY